ncbi:MAG TPA: PilZ domain-containing protein [Steroidobacteraceae bacterium]|nr:PilZ domain-containing protein [Steroidobacteraceae bacterium]
MSVNIESMEHRWGTRVALNAPAEIKTSDGISMMGAVKNASLSGAFIETRTKLPVLTRLWVRPLTASGAWLEACVVRTDSKGLGLEWLDPGLAPLAALMASRHELGVYATRSPARESLQSAHARADAAA